MLQAHIFSPEGIALKASSYPGAEKYGPYLAATTGKAKATTITSVLVPRPHSQLITNGGFESGMAGWQPRSVEMENHVRDTDVRHGGNASARIDKGGYYYSRRFAAGGRQDLRWWARS